MSTLREAAIGAMGALETARNGLAWYRDRYPESTDGSDDEAAGDIDAAIDALRAELAKPDARPAPAEPQPAAQQEPVVTVWQARATHDSKSAWRQVAPTKTESTVEARVEYLKTVRRAGGEPAYEFRALYTSPPQVQRAGLTDEQVFASEDFMSANGLYWGLPMTTLIQIVRCTERAHGITATKGGR